MYSARRDTIGLEFHARLRTNGKASCIGDVDHPCVRLTANLFPGAVLRHAQLRSAAGATGHVSADRLSTRFNATRIGYRHSEGGSGETKA